MGRTPKRFTIDLHPNRNSPDFVVNVKQPRENLILNLVPRVFWLSNIYIIAAAGEKRATVDHREAALHHG